MFISSPQNLSWVRLLGILPTWNMPFLAHQQTVSVPLKHSYTRDTQWSHLGRLISSTTLPSVWELPFDFNLTFNGGGGNFIFSRSSVSIKPSKNLFSYLPFRNTHAHGSHYNPIMQQPALLTGHVTLPAAQPLNVGVAHVMRQQPTSTTSSRKNKQHQSSAR